MYINNLVSNPFVTSYVSLGTFENKKLAEEKTSALLQDSVTISQEAQKAYETLKTKTPPAQKKEELSQEEKKEVEKLKKRDTEVKNHEMSHKMAAGSYGGGIVYEYENGPDGNKYAVGGHVDIDLSKEKSPDATITKAQIVKRAALSPADPSAEDKQVAAEAQKMEDEARKEKLKEGQDQTESSLNNSSSSSSGSKQI